MSRNGSGTYNLPAGNPVTTGTIISSAWANNTLSDMATALTASIAKDGQTTPTANLPMGNFRHINVGDATALTQYLTANQAVNGTPQYLSSISGADTIIASGTFTPTAYAAGQSFAFTAVSSNTGAATLNISSLGAKNIYKRSSGGAVALVAKDVIAGQPYFVIYDGTQFILEEKRPYSQGANIASASTINLDTATGDYAHVTGTTNIDTITLAQGEQRTIVFDGILTLTYGASLLLPSGVNIPTAANDVAVFRGEAGSVVRCVQYTRANGTALVGTTPVQIQSLPDPTLSGNAMTLPASTLALDFRSATLGSGLATTVSGTAAALVIPAGATLGMVNAVQGTVVEVIMNNGGTLEKAVVNLAGGNDLSETGLINTTAISAAATAPNVFYSTTARSNVPYRVVREIVSTQATAGQWATPPSLVQGIGGLVTVKGVSMVRLNTSNGGGSTNTKIRRLTNVVTNQGSDITYADSATLGASFTINTADIYSISYTDLFTGAAFLGLSLNTTQPTVAIQSLTNAAEILSIGFTPVAGSPSSTSWRGYLPAGSVIRPHCDGVTNSTPANATQFTIVRG